jgi:hypothetical protein
MHCESTQSSAFGLNSVEREGRMEGRKEGMKVPWEKCKHGREKGRVAEREEEKEEATDTCGLGIVCFFNNLVSKGVHYLNS